MAEKKTRKPGRFWKRTKTVALTLAFGFTLGSFVFVTFLLPRAGPTTENKAETKKRAGASSIRKASLDVREPDSIKPLGLMYEEKNIPKFDAKINEIDQALVQSLIAEGISLDVLEHQEVTQKEGKYGHYHFQSLVLALKTGPQEAFLNRLKTCFLDWANGARLLRSAQNPNKWEIRVQGVLTHELLFEPAAASPPVPGQKQPRLALIIDDIGESIEQARKLYGLFGSAVTLSILPDCTHTRNIARFGAENGLELMLHVPMEPEEYPEMNPGPGCLFVDMSRRTIHEILTRSIRQVPGLVGVNNHMGSKFTADTRAMDLFLTMIKKHDLFFIDSLTTPQSKGTTVSSRLGVPTLSRDIFIDNDQNVSAILFQLQKAEELAKRRGAAVAIGHPYPETLTALAHWAGQRDTSVRLTKASRLLD
ncbi:MAG: divergent polysaccharide deacetylase family protein [Desulfohalobiaceae bacterium]|nr:divergent polysaccharide deacetylase family protein [Desulfohalobiaceae bacterium]